MWIKSVHLENFRPFYRKNDLDLSTPEGANLVVIFGENMTGKTAIFTAIRWALYGRAFDRQGEEIQIFRPEGGEQLLNSLAASADKKQRKRTDYLPVA